MDALVLFSCWNDHPMAWLLTKKRRHVWCAVRDTERGHWISYDWSKGIPILRYEAEAGFDLKSHYEAQGLEVLETTVGVTPPHGPLQWNNCVGHVKTILAIDTCALVPNGLYKHLTRSNRMFSFLRTLSFAPGFGGSAPAPLPPPPPPSRSDADVQAAALEARHRRASATGRSETILTSGSGVTEEKDSPTKKLLGT